MSKKWVTLKITSKQHQTVCTALKCIEHLLILVTGITDPLYILIFLL